MIASNPDTCAYAAEASAERVKTVCVKRMMNELIVRIERFKDWTYRRY